MQKQTWLGNASSEVLSLKLENADNLHLKMILSLYFEGAVKVIHPAQSQSILVSISPLTDDPVGAGLGLESWSFHRISIKQLATD